MKECCFLFSAVRNTNTEPSIAIIVYIRNAMITALYRTAPAT